MFKAENFGEPWLEDLVLPFPCEVHHCFPRRQPDPDRFSVLVHYTEPRQLKAQNKDVLDYAGCFNLILTNEEDLLHLPNAMFALFGGCWVTSIPSSKRFELSFLYSNGIGSESLFSGYQIRRQIWQDQNLIKLPKLFYTSIKRPPVSIENLNPYPFDSKDALFESMFSLVVENEFQKHYFTEKIIDAFRTYTVPIYFGTPNIGHYFDLSGIIVAHSTDEAIVLINNLKPDDYWARMSAMVRNFELAERYIHLLETIKRYISEGYRLNRRRSK